MSPFAQTFFSRAKQVRSVQLKQSTVFSLNIITTAMVISLALVYVVYINSAISLGYEMRDLEVQIHELTLANEQLELAAREAQSLDRVTHAVKMIGMVEAEAPVYVDPSAPAFALAQ